MFDGYCQIRRAGIMEDGRAQIDLKADDGSFDWNWFFTTTTYAREILAASFAAIACNKKIYCQIADPVQSGAQIIRLGLSK
jgi:PhoPQ-activated pathogenicity-related protein